MIVLRCLRPDRVQQAIKKYVEEFIGPYFTKSVPTNLKDIFSQSKNSEPIVFVLTTGVDPTQDLQKLAMDDGTQMTPLSMGRG
jgi:dynein heavy chain